MSDTTLTTGPASTPDADTLDATDASNPPGNGSALRKKLYTRGTVLIAIGLVLVAFALAPLLVMPARIAVFLVALAPLSMGLRRLGVARFGPDFDLTFVFSALWLMLLVITAALAPLLPFAEHEDTTRTLTAPSYQPPTLLSAHPLGTNNFGLDLLARSVYGARSSIILAVCAVLIGCLIGGALGILAGYFRGWPDRILSIFTNSLLAVPALVLLIALASVLSPTLPNIAMALSLLAIPSMIRLARANTLSFAQSEFVLAARAMGATRWRVMLRELAPNVALPLASLAMVMISVMIIAEASLSFLGLGIEPPTPTWGNMIAEGQGNVFRDHPFVVLVPGAFLFLTVFSFNIIGEKAQNKASGARKGNL